MVVVSAYYHGDYVPPVEIDKMKKDLGSHRILNHLSNV